MPGLTKQTIPCQFGSIGSNRKEQPILFSSHSFSLSLQNDPVTFQYEIVSQEKIYTLPVLVSVHSCHLPYLVLTDLVSHTFKFALHSCRIECHGNLSVVWLDKQ